MKKLLIVALLTLTLCIFFAFFVSAQDVPVVDNLGDPSWYTGNYALITDKTSKVVLSNGDGTYPAYPAYYVLKYSITVKDGAVTEAYVNGVDYSFVNEKTGKNYDLGAMYSVELPNGLTKIVSGIFGHKPKEPNVVTLICSDTVVRIDDHALRETKYMKKVVLSKNINYIGAYAFYKATGLEEVIFPEGSQDELNVSKENIFCGCSSLKELDISKKNIKVLGSSFLSECSSVGKVTLPESLEKIGYCSLYQNPKMYLASDFLPKSLKTVGFHFMSGCKNSNSVLFFPEGFEGFESTHAFESDKYKTPDTTLVFLGKMSGEIKLAQFHSSAGGKMTLIFTKNEFSDLSGNIVQASNDGTLAYIGKTADTTDTDYWVQNGTLTVSVGNAPSSSSKYKVDENGNTLYYISNNSYKVIFCGGDDVEVCYGVRGNVVNSEWGKQFTTPFAFDKDGHTEAGIHYDLTEILSVANCGVDGVCEKTCVLCNRVVEDRVPASKNHTLYEVSPCADRCEVCEMYIQKANQNHTKVEYFVYQNGFMSVGKQGVKCTNEGCIFDECEEKGALVVDYGFSIPEDENLRGLNYCYGLNKEVISEYERVNGCTLGLGAFISTGTNFVNEKYAVDIEFEILHDLSYIMINYGERTDLDDCELVIASVLIEKYENETVKSYLQGKTDKETTDYTSPIYGTLYGISFSSLRAK